jgi:anti-sigma factor RsiW
VGHVDQGIAHAAASELLPWFVSGTLADGERRAVEAHLAVCAECRDEELRCREIRQAVREARVAPSPHPAQLARLVARIDELEQEPAEGPLRALFAAPLSVRLVLAAQLAAMLALVAYIVWPVGPVPYRTLSDPAPAGVPAATALEVRVVFAPEASEAEIRQLLLELGAQVSGGPSPLGAYTVSLPAGAGAEPLPVVLAHLRGHPRVLFAEPVAGAG